MSAPGPILADSRWLAAIEDAYGTRARRLSLAGVEIPGYAVRDLRGRRVFHALADSLADVAADGLAGVLAEAASRLRADGFAEAWIDVGRPGSDLGLRERVRVSPILDLAPGADAIWSGFRDKVRNTVRKAEKAGFAVSDDPSAIDAFHALYARAMDEKGVAIRSKAFLRAILSRFGDSARLYTAREGGELRGGVLIVRNARQAAYPYGAADEAGKRGGVTSLLLWHAIRDLCAHEVATLDLGPSTPGGGTFRFKTHLGAVPLERHCVDVLAPSPAPAPAPAPTAAARPAQVGRLERAIGGLPRALRLPIRTALGRFGRIL